MTLALWNCFSIPFFVAFRPAIAESKSSNLIDGIIDFLFFIDILVNFRTTYFNKRTGDEVILPAKIARNYISSGRFFIDLFASIPIDDFVGIFSSNAGDLQLLGLLKLVRVLRLGKIISHLRTKDNVKMSLKLLQLLLFLIIYIHLIACIWFLLVSADIGTEDEWIPNLDFISYGTDLYERDIWWQYSISFYHSVFMLIPNEIAPRKAEHAAFASMLMIIG